MSKQFIPTRRGTPCEICDDWTGDCRRTEIQLGNVSVTQHLCLKQPDGGDTPTHKYFGLTKDGLWGKYIAFNELPDKSSQTQEEKQRWQRERENRLKQQKQAEHQKLANSLSIEERDRVIRLLHKYWGLSRADRQRIRDRSFTDEQIDQRCFFSLSAFPKLPPRVPSNFPGVSGNKLWLKPEDEGIAIPISDAQGRFVGFQIRRNADDDRGRYKWLGWDGASKLPNGEYPLAYCRPFDGIIRSQAIGLAEGTGFKPQKAADVLGQIIVGASSGQFWNSPLQLLSYIGNAETVEIYPDAGDVTNYPVMQRWHRVQEFLTNRGVEVRYAWWGQIGKEDCPDIDEGVDPNQIEYLSWPQFEALAVEYCEKYRQHQDRQFPCDRSRRQHQEQQFAGDRSQLRSQSKSEIKSKEFENKQNTSCKDEFSSTKTDKAWSDWRKARDFKADQTINQQFFSAPLPEPGTLSFYKSGLGTGKTHQVVQFVESLKDEGWLAISYRNSILLQFCAKSPNFYHLQSELKGKEEEILLRDPHSKIALCIESIIHFKPHYFDDKNVIFDEIESTIDSLFRSETSVVFYRQKAKELFAEILNRAKRVICLDGNLSNLTVNYLKSLLKEPKKLVLIENEYKGNRGKVEFYEGSEDTNGRKYLSDKSSMIEAILNNRNCFAVGSDSRNAVEALDKLLEAKGAKGFRLDSTTINQSWAKKFLNDPKAFILEHQPQYFLYSPSAEAGIDINIKGYFSDIYFLFFGVIYTKKQLQMLGRIRDYLAKIHVFSTYTGIEAYGLSNSPFVEKVQETIISYVLEDAAASLEDAEPRQKVLEVAHQLVALSIDPHFKHECQLICLANHEKVNLRACLKEALISSGYDVEYVKGFKANLKTYNDAKDSVIDQACIDIYQAKDISTSQADKKSSDFELTWNDKCEISRRRLLDRLPGIENAVIKTVIPEQIKQSTNPSLTDYQTNDISINQSQMPCLDGEPSCLNSFADVSNFNGEVIKPPEIPQTESNPEKSVAGSPPSNNDVQIVEREVYINVLSPALIRKLKYENRALVSQMENLWFLNHPEAAKQLQQAKWFKLLKIFTDEKEPDSSKKMNLATHHSRWLKIKTLLELGVMQFLEPDKTWTINSKEVIEFYKAGQNPKVERALGISVGKSKPTEYLGRVLKSLGFTTCSEQINRIRVYRIDPACLSNPDRLAIYHCVAARLEGQLSGEKTIVNWEEVLQPQTQIGQGVSGYTPSTNSFNKISERCAENNASVPALTDILQNQAAQGKEDCTPSPNSFNKTSDRCAEGDRLVPASTDILQNQAAQGEKDCTQGAENLIKTSNRCGVSANIEWLLQLLADLETQPPHPRFSCDDDLFATFNEAEERAMDCGDELLRLCPNYWERISKAIGDWAEILPQTEVLQTQQEAQLKPGVTVVVRDWGCAKYLVQRICEGIAYLKSLSSGVELTAFVSQLQPVTG